MTTTKRKPQTPVRSTRLLAEKIAATIMTAGGSGAKACRLALKDRDEREMCGWGEKPLADRIEEIIKANAQHQRPEPAATGERIQAGLNGWLRSAECCCWAMEDSWAKQPFEQQPQPGPNPAERAAEKNAHHGRTEGIIRPQASHCLSG
jgi:hypothetical protein